MDRIKSNKPIISQDHYSGTMLAEAYHVTASPETVDLNVISAQLDESLEKGLISEELHAKALQQLDGLIKGGGEGSKGGHIIGHTKSGKPIYNEIGAEKKHHYTHDDHAEVAAQYRDLEKKYRNNPGGSDSQKVRDRVQHHASNANYHEIEAGKKKEKSEKKYSEHVNKLADRAHSESVNDGDEKILNDSLHYGVGDHPYAYKEDLKQSGAKHKEGKNSLFGHLHDKEETKKHIAWLEKKHGYLAHNEEKHDLEKAEKTDELKKAYETLGLELKKGGEGSKGGKILGHTRSGKPVYDHASVDYPKFSAQDHKDAAMLHSDLQQHHVKKYNNSTAPNEDNKYLSVHHGNMSRAHLSEAHKQIQAEHESGLSDAEKKIIAEQKAKKIEHHGQMMDHHEKMFKHAVQEQTKHKPGSSQHSAYQAEQERHLAEYQRHQEEYKK